MTTHFDQQLLKLVIFLQKVNDRNVFTTEPFYVDFLDCETLRTFKRVGHPAPHKVRPRLYCHPVSRTFADTSLTLAAIIPNKVYTEPVPFIA